MRIYADAKSWMDGLGNDWYSIISLNPFENHCLYKDVKDDGFIEPEDFGWKPYNFDNYSENCDYEYEYLCSYREGKLISKEKVKRLY